MSGYGYSQGGYGAPQPQYQQQNNYYNGPPQGYGGYPQGQPTYYNQGHPPPQQQPQYAYHQVSWDYIRTRREVSH
ncbi:Ca(2+)-dependent cysteine protease [Neopestalotiopsis sp. 37M]|nr:Ca(2+)-dependent cysteine protease [Neopestalotiopsis sp. 37M]